LRGRPLNGIKLTLDDDQIGLVFEEDKKNDQNKMELKSNFSEIYSWQLDEPKINNKTDSFCKAMNWMDIAKIVNRIFLFLSFYI